MSQKVSFKSRVRKAIPLPVMNLRILVLAMINVCRSDVRECNICGHTGRFLPFGKVPRRAAYCAKCGSIERHRLVALWIDANPDLVGGARMLHFAPEWGLARLFKNRVSEYRSADLDPHLADTVLNIENIDLPDDSVDLVLCSHVLEHVDDTKALRELHRILTPGGRALLMFPLVDGWEETYEDSAHTSAAARTKYYGQSDHVRYYGRDVRDRIRSAGFTLTEFTAEEPSVARYGLVRGDKMFIATKPESVDGPVI